jgi:hypothetical protein
MKIIFASAVLIVLNLGTLLGIGYVLTQLIPNPLSIAECAISMIVGSVCWESFAAAERIANQVEQANAKRGK